ncbi:hypothetical protein DBV05_g10116 [Lasiodiplodia theobromae]|uniref:RelA/SpoT domain-containing protein n=1 Tax=Lasiodiplodia theobromae TaxID=45133 RepID=A0A5N5D1F6_9PEZI|nr:hypothetical protein DBV05_g10116 [Lasiodiplodia theobromae]
MPPQMDETTRVIDEFLRGFRREQRYYHDKANKAKAICEEELRRSGIQAQVTARVKDRHSLREKLHQRAKVRRGYDNAQDIREDIVDLAGVRIGLYFPNHLSLTENILCSRFQIRQSVDHGKSEHVQNNPGRSEYLAQFSGYRGKHFQVPLKAEDNKKEHDEDEDDERAEYNEEGGFEEEDAEEDMDIIEIQVVSMLHHAWTEVEHDLVYKQMSGSVSTDERRILDGLSGLTQLGELLLEQLHEAHLKRSKSENKPFKNFYELGSFLAAQQLPSGLDNGPLEFLYEFLEIVEYHKPSFLESVILRQALSVSDFD